jgi:hypothetical protein
MSMATAFPKSNGVAGYRAPTALPAAFRSGGAAWLGDADLDGQNRANQRGYFVERLIAAGVENLVARQRSLSAASS